MIFLMFEMFSYFFFLIKSCPVTCTIKSPYEYANACWNTLNKEIKDKGWIFNFFIIPAGGSNPKDQ